MTRFIRWLSLICLLAISALTAGAQTYPVLTTTGTAPNHTTTVTTPGGIWSKNIELICPLPMDNGGEVFPFEKIQNTVNSTPVEKHYLISASGKEDIYNSSLASGLRLIDVTNPRSIDKNALRIMLFKGTILSATHTMEQVSVWREGNSGNLANHTLAAVAVHNVEVTTTTPAVKARILLFDLTAALNRVNGASVKEITILNATSREAKVNNSGTAFTDVYLGYIAEDGTDAYNIKPHAMFTEPKTGALILSPNAGGSPGYIDLFKMSSIATHSALTNPPAFVIPTRITETVNGSAVPIRVRQMHSGVIGFASAHESFAEQVGTGDKIRIYIAAWGGYANPGAAVIQDVDFTTPASATVTALNTWVYDTDRRSPERRYSQNTSQWNIRNVHSVQPVYFYNSVTSTNEKFLLTANELAGPRYDRETSTGYPAIVYLNKEFALAPKTTGTNTGAWHHPDTDTDHLPYDAASPTIEDDRILGNYLRIWNTSVTNNLVSGVVGTGSYNGPLGSYDALEQDPTGILRYSAAALNNSAIAPVDADARYATDRKVGPNTVHRMHTVKDDPSRDIYLSHYTQGARIISLPTNFSSTPTVKEKAYFDFYPTANYERDDEQNPTDFSVMPDYFYRNDSFETDRYYHGLFPKNIKTYFMGTVDVKSDFNRTGLESDEKFVYAWGLNGEGYMRNLTSQTGETSERNYKTGFMILRYFDDKLGGTISGYDGTNTSYDRDYRTVNLQGTFNVERPCTVATGAIVNLWDNTELNKATNNSHHYLHIYGTVNVETLLAAGLGKINVKIFVKPGGSLVVKKNAHIVFKEQVHIEQGGLWKIEEGARVILESDKNTCAGKLVILGTSTDRVLLQAKPNTANNYGSTIPVTTYNTILELGGNKLYPLDSRLEVAYADFKNIYVKSIDVTPASPVAISNSSFAGYGTPPGMMSPLVQFRYSIKPGADMGKLVVNQTSFEDRLIPGLSVPRRSVFFSISGLSVENVREVEVDGSGTVGYKRLNYGINVQKAAKLKVKNCSFITCNVGVGNTKGQLELCNNTFSDVSYGSQQYQAQSATYIGNSFTNSSSGIQTNSSNTVYLRSNTFTQYCSAIKTYNTILHMKDLAIITGQTSSGYAKWGRNSFSTLGGRYATYGCEPIDIYISGPLSRLRIACGYNQMNNVDPNSTGTSSLRHVFSEINLTFDPSYNSWPNGTNYSVVKNDRVTANGYYLNQPETVTTACSTLTGQQTCAQALPDCADNPHAAEWMSWAQSDARFDTVFTTAKPFINDTSLTTPCRVGHARNALNVAVLQDSAKKYREILGELSIAANPLVTPCNAMKSAARLMRGEIYERLNVLDSALMEYNVVVSTYSAGADSLPAAWAMQAIGVVQADTLLQDSLHTEYQNRILRDLRRWIDSAAGYSRTRADIPEEIVEAPVKGMTTELYQNSPNPFSDKTMLSFTLAETGRVKLTVLDALGNTIAVIADEAMKAGKYEFPFTTEKLISGMYLYRLETQDKTYTQRMMIVK